MEAIKNINDTLLKEIGIEKIGHRLQIMRNVEKLNNIKIELTQNMLYFIIITVLVALFAIRIV